MTSHATLDVFFWWQCYSRCFGMQWSCHIKWIIVCDSKSLESWLICPGCARTALPCADRRAACSWAHQVAYIAGPCWKSWATYRIFEYVVPTGFGQTSQLGSTRRCLVFACFWNWKWMATVFCSVLICVIPCMSTLPPPAQAAVMLVVHRCLSARLLKVSMNLMNLG